MKLVDGLVGRRKARILFWVVVAVSVSGSLPTLINSIKIIFKEFEPGDLSALEIRSR